ncbi:S-adenosyl-L-methionine-dependent methyltransferase [Lophium mytilinum]|uniref:S-adenosyl-L-methionine-dependent methyltransferase n=1 Tax=Lophium mytilinum TaxID=390894 RepID=A0A6A6QXB3_9PEZI|nr:S-adenosyl-L-methionine-dependent methyltransferase [Lophium mytilinum]
MGNLFILLIQSNYRSAYFIDYIFRATLITCRLKANIDRTALFYTLKQHNNQALLTAFSIMLLDNKLREDAVSADRTYHNTEAAYGLPNDSIEHKRLELQHFNLLELMGGRIIHAPLGPDITHALDIGCGTGIITHEIASKLPDAIVTGIDLSPIPAIRPKLPNIQYLQGDFNELVRAGRSTPEAAKFQPETLDYIFSRLLVMGMPHWQSYVSSVAQLLRQGGWAEIQEWACVWYDAPASASPEAFLPHDVSYDSTNEVNEDALRSDEHSTDPYHIQPQPTWSALINEALRAKSLDPAAGNNIATYMHRAGLTDITTRRYIWAFGGWEGLSEEAKTFSAYADEVLTLLIESLLQRFGAEMDVDPREIENCIREFREDVRSGKRRLYTWYSVTVGRKP